MQLSSDKAKPSLLTNGLLGVAQIIVWGGSFFLLAVLADPVSKAMHWPHTWVYGSLSIALAISGLLAPLAGRYIANKQANALLLYSGLVMGLGLLIIAFSPWLWVFILGWCVIGVSMAMGLYDALFALLGKHYGSQAKGSITQITLISGFATTATWPLLAWMISEGGWRFACISYALLLGLAIWPLYKVALPAQPIDSPEPAHSLHQLQTSVSIDGGLLRLTAINFTIAAVIMTALSVQLIDLLQAKGLSVAVAVSVGTLIGPCQVGVRLLDLIIPQKHPIWTTFLSGILTLVGLSILGLSPAFAAAGIVFYSLGNGLRAILRGTLPLELFGIQAYPIVLGRLARPALLAQAVTPLVGGYLMQHYGAQLLVGVLCGLALLNLGITAFIKFRLRDLRLPDSTQSLMTH